jgi:NADH-quinone oxidoreductase subunit G
MIGGESVPPAMCYYTKLKERKMPLLFSGSGKRKEADPRPMPKLMALV